MSGRTARYQGGSIVSFVIIAVLITAAVGVGLYVLRQRSEQSRVGSAAHQDAPTELPGSTVANNDKKDEAGSETFPSSAKKEADTTKKTDTTTSSNTDNAARSSEAASSSAAALPETGPEQLLIIPVLAVVTYGVTAYAGSSRTLARLR